MSRDFQGHEKKKPKKDSKKSAAPSPTSAQPVEVEVVRKNRKKNEDYQG